MPYLDSLLIPDLLDSYRALRQTPRELITRLLDDAGLADERKVWITRLSPARVMDYVDALSDKPMERMPLYGIPFVIKDNIDLAHVPTTAACPAYAYTPDRSAAVVERLIDAGAIPLGKTNLDQFATGLVGARSPYGACRNSFNLDYIAGGSSAGSAVAVATGLASFALGTDTAGSGRVPAAFNNVVGLKPSLGRLSTSGVVPACRSLDCVSIFGLTADDAARVLEVAQGFDPNDDFSRVIADRPLLGLRFGIPRLEDREFFGDAEYERLFGAAIQRLQGLGGTPVPLDFAPFFEAARLLYEGPWVAERYAAVGAFIDAHPGGAVHPVTRTIIEAGRAPTAVAAFEAQYRLMALRRRTESVWREVDVLMTPTTGTIYRLAELEADPIRLNTHLGLYTNFMNLLDHCGVAVPAGFRQDGLPFGVTLVGPRGADRGVLKLAGRLHHASGATLGALDRPVPEPPRPPARVHDGYRALAVCGAHMQGLPLNGQLTDCGAYLVGPTCTTAHYRLFALPGGPPPRPGLLRTDTDGAAIGVEVWALPLERWGSFLNNVPVPLAIGRVELESGEWVAGFLCESYATEGAADITSYGNWRDYLKAASL